jgi:hypothetical protein
LELEFDDVYPSPRTEPSIDIPGVGRIPDTIEGDPEVVIITGVNSSAEILNPAGNFTFAGNISAVRRNK